MKKTVKPYKFSEEVLATANEPALAYGSPVADVSVSDKWADYCTNGAVPNTHPSTFGKWNPNVPLHCTQEEFLEHIRSIEQSIERGEFMTAEESERDFEQWKREFLANRI